uniref:HTH CENPB-type domain-containing protein n=1 Tax=Timema tahoe TaxID=61484 RepID=A0A7R9FPG5_9NEOP|nr:unnamed protein product [Timema tahoe]
MPIIGPLVQQKALKLNVLLIGDTNLTSSNGWLDRWIRRHGIIQLQMIINYNLLNWLILYAALQKRFITVMTGLNFRMLPSKSRHPDQEQCASSFKVMKD